MANKKKLEIYSRTYGRISYVATEACHGDCSAEDALDAIIEIINETEQELADDDT